MRYVVLWHRRVRRWRKALNTNATYSEYYVCYPIAHGLGAAATTTLRDDGGDDGGGAGLGPQKGASGGHATILIMRGAHKRAQ